MATRRNGHWLAVLAALAGVLGLPAAALAGGWLVVTLDALPREMTVGQASTLGFMVRNHGQTPLARVSPRLEFTHRETGQRIAATATDQGPIGHYTVSVTLDRPGAWDWSVEAWETRHPMPALMVVSGTATPATSPAAAEPASTWAMLLASLGIVLAIAAVAVALGGRRPRLTSLNLGQR
jgi:hypothetical protein